MYSNNCMMLGKPVNGAYVNKNDDGIINESVMLGEIT